MFRHATLIAGLSLTLAAAPAARAEGLQALTVFSESVRVADLDLTRHADAVKALNRVTQAAARICGYGYGYLTVSAAATGRACRDRAVAEAVDRINSPMLSLALSERVDRPRRLLARR